MKENGFERRWLKARDTLRSGDTSGALYLFKALANDGDKVVFREIGNIYERGGKGVAQDIDSAITWYRRAIDEADDADACIALAGIYFYGKKEAPDYVSALHYLELIEDNKMPRAQILMARMYRTGKGVERNIDLARSYLESAIASGNVLAIKEMSQLEKDLGNHIKANLLFCKGFIKAFLIARKDPYDSRLKGI